MSVLYSFLTYLSLPFIWASQFFSRKMKSFVQGRQNVFETLQNRLVSDRPVVWFHCASLGEFEQGLPVMQWILKKEPSYQLVVTFFSPSGYEAKKGFVQAQAVTYLPLDTPANARRFVRLVNPSLAVFVKYEFWPNYLKTLHQNQIPTLLISGVFREQQTFFKPYGSFMRKALARFDHLFVQDQKSAELLASIGHNNVTVSGDTRFDRVSHQIEQDNSLEDMDQFVQQHLCVVCGSTWQEDEEVLLPYINNVQEPVKFVIAPHKMDAGKIEDFQQQLNKKSIRFTELVTEKDARNGQLADADVFILDTIGLLSKVYSYADIAYVGGAMGTTGLHNILEAATFGVPVIIGKNYRKFPEAIRLRQLAGLYSVDSAEGCNEMLNKLVTDSALRKQTGMIAGHFVNQNTGATATIAAYIEKIIQSQPD